MSGASRAALTEIVVYTYVCMYVCIYLHINIYIHIYRYRDRDSGDRDEGGSSLPALTEILKPKPKAKAGVAAGGAVPKLVEDMSVENLVDWLRQLNVNEEAIKVLEI